ncbi:MAG: adenylyl-sulfate kinase [Schwartzia sp.]|nr:adenylyl-sulfate kinase [Schwartzia sp. (in: firmicutes)]
MHKAGRVYWITGLKASGKTTIGTALYYALRKEHDNVLILDGDILKQFVGDTFGYADDERLARGRRYSQLCKLLADQGIIVVICTIAMFHEIREWNRTHIKGYVEVFVDTPVKLMEQYDKSGLYSCEEILANYKKAQLPLHADITLRNDGTQSVANMVRDILAVTPKTEDDFARDHLYWNQYYMKRPKILGKPSNFAMDIADGLVHGKQLLELGCGNGRDSLFFMKRGLYVTGVDASDEAIRSLQVTVGDSDKAMFICDDFVKCRAVFQRQYDYIYSRFTLHAITDEQEDELLRNIKDAMFGGSKLFIEARTIHDDIYGKGTEVAPNTYIYEGHFRRFIDPKTLENKIIRFGYKILSLEEDRGFSKTEQSDPILMRIVASMD